MDFGQRFLLFSLWIVLLIVAVALTVCVITLFHSQGPPAVLVAGLLTAAVCGFAFFKFATIELETAWAPVVVGIISFAIAASFPISEYNDGAKTAEYHRQMSAIVSTYFIENFKSMDKNGNGEIDVAEMDSALEGVDDTNAQYRIRYLKNYRSNIGHVIDSYTTTTMVWISHGKSGGHMQPVTTTHYIYAVNKTDLENYPAEIRHEYRNW